MFKKLLSSAAAVSVCGICLTAFNSHAASIDDVASVARSLGFPESYIQQGYNQYYENPDKYTPEVLDSAISQLYGYEEQLKEQLGISGGNVPTTAPAATEAPTEFSGTNSTQPSQETTTATAANETTSNNISVSDRPDKKDFINMTLEEKRAYIATLSPEEQQAFFSTLSPEELKSIVKQLPSNDKLDVVDSFVKAGDAMGIKVTVDDINGNDIKMSMRNENGELIDVASVGVVVENTGHNYTKLYSISAAMILSAFGGLGLVIKKCFRKRSENE